MCFFPIFSYFFQQKFERIKFAIFEHFEANSKRPFGAAYQSPSATKVLYEHAPSPDDSKMPKIAKIGQPVRLNTRYNRRKSKKGLDFYIYRDIYSITAY